MLTRSQINRAGRRLRKAETPDEADRQIYDEFRATFAEPLGEVVEALRGVAGGAPVTYRLKRFETTVEKLRRLTSDLARLEDIGGCRVVVPAMREQRDILGLVRREFEVIRERDYQVEPRGGYRALHLVVRSQGKAVEVQLRTELEDQWANTVERLAERLDPQIKYGAGPSGVGQTLDSVSQMFGRFDKIGEPIYQYRAAFEAIRDDLEGADLVFEMLDRLDSALGASREELRNFLHLLESALIDDAVQPEQLAALERAIGGMVLGLDSATKHLQDILATIESADA